MRYRSKDRSTYFFLLGKISKKSAPILLKRTDFAMYILVGVTGFEPAASWSRTKRTTKLCHTPRLNLFYFFPLLAISPPCDW